MFCFYFIEETKQVIIADFLIPDIIAIGQHYGM